MSPDRKGEVFLLSLRRFFRGLVLNDNQLGTDMVAAMAVDIPKHVDQKRRGSLGKTLPGDQFGLADGALDEVPFSALKYALGRR